jgi:hypothetical protein
MDYRSIIIAHFPECAHARFKVLTHSWDSVAIDVDDEFIFKFPVDAKAREALRMEARLLMYIRPRVSLPVPNMTLHGGPPLFSRHRKLKGEHLVDFDRLSDAAKDRLSLTLSLFYAELHALDRTVMADLGAEPLPAWGDADDILRVCRTRLPDVLHVHAEGTCRAWAALPPDPYGMTYGFFDGHGWNMAFDYETETLNGIYDFADSGIAPLHQDFIYASLTSHDLAERIVNAYEKITGRRLERARIDILTSMHRLWELWKTEDDADDINEKIRQVGACVRYSG